LCVHGLVARPDRERSQKHLCIGEMPYHCNVVDPRIRRRCRNRCEAICTRHRLDHPDLRIATNLFTRARRLCLRLLRGSRRLRLSSRRSRRLSLGGLALRRPNLVGGCRDRCRRISNACWCARPATYSNSRRNEQDCSCCHSNPCVPGAKSALCRISRRRSAGGDMKSGTRRASRSLDRSPHLILGSNRRAIVIARCSPDDFVDAVFFTH
jgi:hypothetical protein